MHIVPQATPTELPPPEPTELPPVEPPEPPVPPMAFIDVGLGVGEFCPEPPEPQVGLAVRFGS